MKLFIVLTLAMGFGFFNDASAATKKNYCGSEITGMKCKNIPGNRRNELGRQVSGGNPVAVALKNGDLFVYYTKGTAGLRKCAVAGNVVDFKVSNNPGDIATAYFVTNTRKNPNRLFDLRMAGDVSRNCPKADKKDMLSHSRIGGKLAKKGSKYQYKIVSNGKSNSVGFALTDSGHVLEWTDKRYYKHNYQYSSGYNKLYQQAN